MPGSAALIGYRSTLGTDEKGNFFIFSTNATKNGNLMGPHKLQLATYSTVRSSDRGGRFGLRDYKVCSFPHFQPHQMVRDDKIKPCR
ncbi:Positive regulator of purine utilization [Fusarium oxysporum f. sp. albedinis]|nr:Positive regulator of purine utilization [Fusarium oxysporum f. sp. albedinis]